MTNFYDFALKIETSLAKWVFKPILETTNANNVIVYVWFIYSFFDKKRLKNMQYKKNNCKCTKFIIKN